MRRPRLSVRGKIVATIIAVSTVVLALGAWAAFDAVRDAEGRGRYLEKHYLRYKAALAELGTSEYAVAKLIATDPTLAQALNAGEPAQVVESAKRFSDALQSTIAPDLFTKADAGTIRKLYGTNVGENAVHGSDSADNARIEIGYFFAASDVAPVA